MSKIKDLSAPQLARHAFNVFLFSGRHVTGARLIYHALRLDHREPEALRCLSDMLDAPGTEQLSAAVLEYALALEPAIPDPPRRILDDLLFQSKWSWGFSRHHSGEPHLLGEAFKNRHDFDVDNQRYQEFLDGVVGLAGSLDQALRGAHTLCGSMGGLLVHQTHGAKAPLDAIFETEAFVPTSQYAEWLETDTHELDALEKARLEKSTVQKSSAKPWWKVW